MTPSWILHHSTQVLLNSWTGWLPFPLMLLAMHHFHLTCYTGVCGGKGGGSSLLQAARSQFCWNSQSSASRTSITFVSVTELTQQFRLPDLLHSYPSPGFRHLVPSPASVTCAPAAGCPDGWRPSLVIRPLSDQGREKASIYDRVASPADPEWPCGVRWRPAERQLCPRRLRHASVHGRPAPAAGCRRK